MGLQNLNAIQFVFNFERVLLIFGKLMRFMYARWKALQQADMLSVYTRLVSCNFDEPTFVS